MQSNFRSIAVPICQRLRFVEDVIAASVFRDPHEAPIRREVLVVSRKSRSPCRRTPRYAYQRGRLRPKMAAKRITAAQPRISTSTGRRPPMGSRGRGSAVLGKSLDRLTHRPLIQSHGPAARPLRRLRQLVPRVQAAGCTLGHYRNRGLHRSFK